MTEVQEEVMKQHQLDEKQFASNCKANSALALGIVGTALGALNMGAECMHNRRNHCYSDGDFGYNGRFGRNGYYGGPDFNGNFVSVGVRETGNGLGYGYGMSYPGGRLLEDEWILRNERKECGDVLDMTKQRYEDKLQLNASLTNEFFKLYKMNVDNSWSLYKNHIDDAFALYKQERDDKDCLNKRIDNIDKKVDILAAIRPYQDALINAKIDNVALVSDFNLARRTCRMIEGELVLPNDPTITGYPSQTNRTPHVV